MISKTRIRELKQILQEDYGQTLSQKEVSYVGNALIGYFNTITKIYFRDLKIKQNGHENNKYL